MPAKKKRAATAPSKKPARKKAAKKKKHAPTKQAKKRAAARKPPKKKDKKQDRKQAKRQPAARKQASKTVAAAVVAAPTVPAPPPDPTEELAQALAALTLSKKAEDVIVLRVTDLTSYADFFVLASAPSERQVQAIARHAADEMKRAGKAPLGTEGLEQGHWVLVDYGAVVLHVFLANARQYYDLEGFWSDAPRVEVEEARGLETLARLGTAAAEARAADIDLAPALAANE